MDTKDTEGSGWKVLSIDKVSLDISELTPLLVLHAQNSPNLSKGKTL